MKYLGKTTKFVLSMATAALALPLELIAAKEQPYLPSSRWEVAFGAALFSDYNFRGITQSNHKPSVWAYYETRFNVAKDMQLFAGIAGASIAFPNRAAAQFDLYSGFRPTFGKLTLEFGFFYYWYPGGQCFNAAQGGDCLTNADPITLGLPVNGNIIKNDLSFWEIFAKATFAATEAVSFGGAIYYSPSVARSGANGTYVSGNVKFATPSNALPNGFGGYWSAEVGHWYLGTSDSFYCTGAGGPCMPPFPNGIPYKSYTTWNVGLGITKSMFTVDLRYYDTGLSRGDCNAFTSDHTARFTADFSSINTAGFGSNWCSKAFIVSVRFDLTNPSKSN